MRRSSSRSSRARLATMVGIFLLVGSDVILTQDASITPVTDAELQNPAPDDWLMWRRTLNSWGYSPLDQISRANVSDLRMIWTRALGPGLQQGTPLVHDGVMYKPNPRDVVQAIDAATGDLIWEHRRDRPDDLEDFLIAGITDTNRTTTG